MASAKKPALVHMYLPDGIWLPEVSRLKILGSSAAAFSYNPRPICAKLKDSRFYMSEQYVETVIIGAGPVGLFQIFELGLLGITTHIIDSLGSPGGQCAELYPDKPIYDIPALPICGAQELINRLMEQAKPFHATFHLGQEVTELRVLEGGKFHVATSAGTRLNAGAVVIAGGVGSFQPRRLSVPGVERFEGRSVHYRVRSAGDFFLAGPGVLRRRGLGAGLDGGVVRESTLVDFGAPAGRVPRGSGHGGTHARFGRCGQDAITGGQRRRFT